MEGKVLVINMYGCDFNEINSEEKMMDVTKKIADVCKVHIIKTISHKFDPQGVSTLALISESHISFHTWPEKGYLNLVFYTCGKEHPKNAIPVLKKAFRHSKMAQKIFEE